MNNESVRKVLDELIERYLPLESCRDDIQCAYEMLCNCYENGGKLLICGSGGSASDALHITGELMKSFITKRATLPEFGESLRKAAPEDAEYLLSQLQGTLPAVALVENSALATAVLNDISGDIITGQQVYGLGNPGDVLMAISTSGNSKGGVYSIEIARAKGMKTIGLTGMSGGKYKSLCDCTIRVPAQETYKIQEYHLPVYHAICRMLEVHFFGE